MNYLSLDMSSSGKYVVTCTDDGGIYKSGDYGNTLNLVESGAFSWGECCISEDGLRLAAVVSHSLLLSNDGGITWSTKMVGYKDPNIYPCTFLNSSYDNKYMYIMFSGFVVRSDDYGDIFSFCDVPEHAWNAVGVSKTGQYVSVVGNGSQIYVSGDFGVSFVSADIGRSWNMVAVSGDGQVQVASVSGGFLYVSLDAGLTWSEKAVERNWNKISVSHTGQYIIASESNGRIYKSSDYGDTWTEIFASDQDWRGLKLTGDGRYIKACVYGGSLWSNKNIITGTPPFGSLGAGEYDIIVRDSVGATDYKYDYLLGEDGQLRIDSVSLSHETATDADDGILQIVIRGGIAPYQVSWMYEGAFYSDDTDLEFLSAGEYSVTIADSVGDVITDSFILGDEGELSLELVSLQHSASPVSSNGAITVNVSGGSKVYVFTWLDSGDNVVGDTQNIDGLDVGVYRLEVSDGLSMESLDNLSITVLGHYWVEANIL